jgi:hypothetical protein
MNTRRLLTIILAIFFCAADQAAYSAADDADVVGVWIGTCTKSDDPTDVGTTLRFTFDHTKYACIQTRGKVIVNSWSGPYTIEADQVKLTYKDGSWSAAGAVNGDSLVLQTTGGTEQHGTIELHKNTK